MFNWITLVWVFPVRGPLGSGHPLPLSGYPWSDYPMFGYSWFGCPKSCNPHLDNLGLSISCQGTPGVRGPLIWGPLVDPTTPDQGVSQTRVSDQALEPLGYCILFWPNTVNFTTIQSLGRKGWRTGAWSFLLHNTWTRPTPGLAALIRCLRYKIVLKFLDLIHFRIWIFDKVLP